jgi:hypothetical protein
MQRAIDSVLANLTLQDLLKPENEMGAWLAGRPVQIQPVAKSPD